ncbi:MAG: hypothetical protein OXC62_02395, partial [Aestuariivita sp.]|nr:hypothetical protein [Aestuariivita sp.]
MTEALPAYAIAPERELIFHGGRTDRYPFRVMDHGLFSLRFGVLVCYCCFASRFGADQWAGLGIGFTSKEVLMRMRIANVDDVMRFVLPDKLKWLAAARNKMGLVRALLNEMIKLRTERHRFDVALVYRPRAWSDCFEDKSFNLHHFIEAYCAPTDAHDVEDRLPCQGHV